MKKLLLITLGILLVISATGFAGPEERDHSKRLVFEKYLWADGVNPRARYLDQLMVKFFDEDMVRLRNGELTSLNGTTSLGYARDFLARHPEIRVEVIITNKTEEQYTAHLREIEEQSGWDLVDLFSFYRFQLPGPAADPKALLADILNAPEVETAYYEPIPIEAVCQDLGSPTPNYAPNQTYHDPAPTGTDYDYARTAFGADIVDGVIGTWVGIFETGMQTTHEDFTSAIVRTSSTPGYSDHGTAVTGIVGGCDDNNVGVLGYLADETMNLYQRNSPDYGSVADIYNFANGQLIAGEVTTNSWQYFSDPMPPGQSCPCNPGQNGCVTIEYNAALKAEIEAGVAEGIHYFISAGNGCVNLDDATYGTTFRYSTDSGSNYIGAVKNTLPHDSSCYTNWGERVDLCAWGNGIYTTGYGTVFSGTGPNEYYDNDFGGTSGAGPIVAGCGGVLNNIYRDINAGANISTSTMRSWLRTGGTEAGTFPGTDDPEMPNLFAITSPDLNPDLRTGWSSYYVIPRNTGDADGANCLLPTNLNSEPSTTYWNVAWENTSNFGTATPGGTRTYLDDVYIFWASYGSMGPLFRGYYVNASFPPGTNVRGGRHTVRLTCDPLGEVTEYYEDNNSGTEQFAWNPRALTAATPLTFSAPPLKTVTDQPGTYYNVDGYYFSSGFGGYWDLFGVMASTTTADYDARIYSEAITSTNGFDDYESGSAYTPPVIDFVGKNGNFTGAVSGVSVLNWDGESADHKVEGVTSDYLGTPGYGPSDAGNFTISADQIMKAVEFYVNELVSYEVECRVSSGDANLSISIFGPDDVYFGRINRNAYINAHGSGMSETLCFTPTETGFHLAVFHKYGSADYANSATFDAYIGKSVPDLTPNLNTGWSHKIVVTQSSGSPPFSLPATLSGNQNTNLLHLGLTNLGCVASPGGLSNVAFYRDGPTALTTGDMIAWGPGEEGWAYNQGPIWVFGGRHNIAAMIDVNSEVVEWREDNNRWDEQFVWTPFYLGNQSPLATTFTAPNWRNFQSEPIAAAWNQDGYQFTGGYWSGVATVPMDAGDQYLCMLYDPTTGSENGFDVDLAHSFTAVDGALNFVVENGNVNGNPATFDVGVTNNHGWPMDTSNGNYRLYQCNRFLDLEVNALNGPYTLGLNHLIHVFDVYLTSGVPKRFILDNLGATDLGLAIFDADDAYGSRTSNGHYTNAGGDGADETVVFTPTTTGYHGVVVFKNDVTDLPSTDYRLIIGDRVPAAPMHMVIQTINSQTNPIQMRVHWDSVLVDINGDPMNVDQYRVYYTLDPNLSTFPAGWTVLGTTTQATMNVTVGVTVGYFRMVVVAEDSDGYILSHTPLPDGLDLTGTRLPDAGTLISPIDSVPTIRAVESQRE